MSDGWIVVTAMLCSAMIGFAAGVLFEEHRAQKKSKEWLEATEDRHAADLNAWYARGRYDQLYEIKAMSTTGEFTACVAEKFKQLPNSRPEGSKP